MEADHQAKCESAYQIKASVKVNNEKLMFYWSLGKDIVEMHAESKWGDGFYKNICRDLKAALPDANCFSETNIWYMKHFYLMYNRFYAISPQLGEKLSSGVKSIENEVITPYPQAGDKLTDVSQHYKVLD